MREQVCIQTKIERLVPDRCPHLKTVLNSGESLSLYGELNVLDAIVFYDGKIRV